MSRGPLRRAAATLRALTRVRLVEGPLLFEEDGVFTRQRADFTADPRFVRAYAAGRSTGSWGGTEIRWRAYVACWAAHQASLLDGDFVECGVNRGGLARTIVGFLPEAAWTGRRFWLLDTFRGLVDEQLSEDDRRAGRTAGGYEECFEDVQRTFAAFPFVRLVRGTVPDTLPQVDAPRIAFLSIDMNCVPPEIAAADAFWPRVVTGGVVLLDDYGFAGHEPQGRAFDAFARERGLLVLPLPTGQGLLIKP